MSQEEIIYYIKSFQLSRYIDEEKAELEYNDSLNRFIDLVIKNQEFLLILYANRLKFNRLVIPLDEDLNLKYFLNIFQDLTYKHNLIEGIYHSIKNQFGFYLVNKDIIKKLIRFLNLAVQKGFLSKNNEFLYYCIKCHIYYITNKILNRCLCEKSLISFTFAILPDILKKSVQTGHIIEHLVLNYLKQFKIKLIGIDYRSLEQYTSIQYSGVGTGGNENAEFDLIAIKNNFLVFIECKFNQTTYKDIKDFVRAADIFGNIISTKFRNLKIIKIIITYDKSRLEVPKTIENFKIIELQNESLNRILDYF